MLEERFKTGKNRWGSAPAQAVSPPFALSPKSLTLFRADHHTAACVRRRWFFTKLRF